jgi:hypothetical protein
MAVINSGEKQWRKTISENGGSVSGETSMAAKKKWQRRQRKWHHQQQHGSIKAIISVWQ